MPKNHTPIAPRELRFRWYRQVEENGLAVPKVCDIFGISKKTYYKWYRRDHGLGSNQYKNRAEHPHTKIKGRVRVLLVEAKKKYNYGPEKMRLYLKRETGVEVSGKNIYLFMKKKGLIRKPQRKQEWYEPMKEPYRALKLGENVQLDVKYVPAQGGWWDYQFRFLDTVSNLQYALTLPLRDSRSTIRAFTSAERSLPFPIVGVQTDNGGEFRGIFHEYLVRRGIAHRYIPKRSAPWNGKVERANRSVDDEFYLNLGRPWRKLYQYTHWYNHERPHLGRGMNGLTPYQKYLSLTGKNVTLEG
ncbi:transposase [Patescibacteria group bacterium]|nr:MAG: transposase [Patescibacteria group bacterium]